MNRRGGFEPRRIVVVVTRQIGDVLLTTPLLSAARARWPEARIDVLGMAGTLGILAGQAALSSCIEVGPARSWAERRALVRRLWRRWDLALIAEASDRAYLLAFLAAPVRAGLVPQTRSHAWWKRLLLSHGVIVAGVDRHVASEKVALLEPWVAPMPTPAVTPPAAAPLPDDLARALDARPVVVQVPSMWRYKQWPLAHYAEVVRALVVEGHQVVLTGGPADADRAKVAEVAARADSPRVIDACGRLDFAQLAGLLSRAALYIGPDTSVTHLAAASGVAVVALFGPTDPARWGPLGPDPDAANFRRRSESPQLRGKVVLLQGPGACVPCGRAGCEDRQDSVSRCLEAIEPAQVIAEARRLLAAPTSPGGLRGAGGEGANAAGLNRAPAAPA